jgi:aldehyde:ferredoxin oxidoreductase
VTDYYVEHGWDPQTGAPTDDTLQALGLSAYAA